MIDGHLWRMSPLNRTMAVSMLALDRKRRTMVVGSSVVGMMGKMGMMGTDFGHESRYKYNVVMLLVRFRYYRDQKLNVYVYACLYKILSILHIKLYVNSSNIYRCNCLHSSTYLYGICAYTKSF